MSSIKPFIPKPILALRGAILSKYYRFNQEAWRLAHWKKEGKPAPPPHIIKRKTILNYQKVFKLPIFVETGTFQGAMIEAVKKAFPKIYTIELDNNLHAAALDKFKAFPHIHCLKGDSGEVIVDLLATLDQNCVFWLDGHFSEGITAKGILETPIINEMNAIEKNIRTFRTWHIILIDDARCFDGTHDYPHLDEFRSYCARLLPDYTFDVKYDIIRLIPKSKASLFSENF